MNKKELIHIVSNVTNFTKKDVDLVLTSALETIIVAVSQKETVRLVGFGSFRSRERKIASVGLKGPSSTSSLWAVRFLAGKFFQPRFNNPLNQQPD